MPKPPLKTVALSESYGQSGARVDMAQGLIEGVKVLGLVSKNRRRYLREAAQGGLRLYEGVRVNIDHPSGPNQSRGLRDRFGRLANVRMDGDDVRADLRFNPKHQMAEAVAWWVENDPEALGLSHNAVGQGRSDRDGTLVVEKILSVRSVDLVADPATTKSLFEGTMDPESDMGGAADPAGAGGGDLEAQIAQLVHGIASDGAMDKKAKLKKIAKALDLMADEGGDSDDSGPPPKPPAHPAGAEESLQALRASADPNVKKLVEQLDGYRAKDALASKLAKGRQLCEQMRLPGALVTDVFLDSLAEARDERHMKALIEDRRALAGRPRSASPAAPNGGGSVDAKQFAARLRS